MDNNAGSRGAVPRSLLEPPSRSGDARDPSHEVKGALAVAFVGYVVLTVVVLGIGFLLTHPLNGSVGRWDEHVNEQFARRRTTGWNDVTSVATSAVNTLPAVLIAAVLSTFLAVRRRFREAALIVLALVIEITVFLSVTFVVARPRPDVPRLNSTPSTSSFPSGHTAAATVLLVGIALVIICVTSSRVVRMLSVIVAAALAVLVGFGRVYRGLHHPTDVLVGALLGLACLAVAALAIRQFARTRQFAEVDELHRVDLDERTVAPPITAAVIPRDRRSVPSTTPAARAAGRTT